MASLFTKPARPVNKVFLHCSASDSAAYGIKEIKQDHLKRGFTDVGYHFFIDKKGKLIAGRPLEKVPAAQEGHNTGSIAICLAGLTESKFTKEQFATLTALAVEINAAYAGGVTFHGHREVNRGKICPVFDYKKLLKLDPSGKLGV